MLNRKEKEEFLRLAGSSELKKDFEMLRKNSRRLLNMYRLNADDYIKFLTFANNLVGHRPKPFKKIEGDSFKI